MSTDPYQLAKLELKTTYIDTGRYEEARTRLLQIIDQHKTQFGEITDQLPRTKVYGQRIMLEHILRHLIAVIEQDNPSFLIDLMDGSTPTTGHHLDIVIDALLRPVPEEFS